MTPTDKVSEAVEAARTILEAQRPPLKATGDELSKAADAIIRACHNVSESWSGSFAGYHGRLYFDEFGVPPSHLRFSVEWGGSHGLPDGWEERRPEEVRAQIETIAGGAVSLAKLEDDVDAFRERAEDARRELVIALSPVTYGGPLAKEEALAKELESLKLGQKRGEIARQFIPGTLMTRDMNAIAQGTCFPAHLYYQTIAEEVLSVATATEAMFVLADRLTRQLQRKGLSVSTDSQKLDDLHPAVCAKCTALFKPGTYAEAAEKGFKVVRDRLRDLTGFETGSEAFGKGGLFVKGAAAHNVEIDFNEGVKFLTMAIDRFRNEKSHSSDAQIDDPARAYEYLSLASLAMHLLDKAEIRKN